MSAQTTTVPPVADDDSYSVLRSRIGLLNFMTGKAFSERIVGAWRSPHREAAENLLLKATRVLKDDRARAIAYVERAVRLPFDEEEDGPPAGIEAHMLLYTLVSDEFEAAEKGDSVWLDAALAVLESDADERGRSELHDVLEELEPSPHLTADERRRLKSALPTAPPRQSLWDLRLPEDELRDRVLAVLDIGAAYLEALDEQVS